MEEKLSRTRAQLYSSKELRRINRGIENVTNTISSIDDGSFNRRPDLDITTLEGNSATIAAAELGSIKTHLEDVSLPYLMKLKKVKMESIETLEEKMLDDARTNLQKYIDEGQLPPRYQRFVTPQQNSMVESASTMSYGSSLLSLFEEYNTNTTRFAAEAGIPEPTLRALINGVSRDGIRKHPQPTPETKEKIEKALDRYASGEIRHDPKFRKGRGRPRSVTETRTETPNDY